MANEKVPSLRDDDDDDGEMNAADEPTAVWDANALRNAGLGDLINKPESEPPPAATPAATEPRGPSIVVDSNAAGAAARAAAPRQPAAPPLAPSSELSWTTTALLAAGLGALVYFLIRFLR